MHPSNVRSDPASFRDPAGFVFNNGREVLRAVTAHGAADYEHFMRSGLGAALIKGRLLLVHEEIPADGIPAEEMPWTPGNGPGIHCILRPEQLEFVSYPYEWCFSQLKDAALLTLEIQKRALAGGMSLKDASAYNVQFHAGRPVFIDTLSFEADPGGPWVAYEQFCRQFLAPLLLMREISPGFGRFLSADLGGIGLGLASRMLSWRTYLNAGALLHVHLHASAIARQGRSGAGEGREARRGGGIGCADGHQHLTWAHLPRNLVSGGSCDGELRIGRCAAATGVGEMDSCAGQRRRGRRCSRSGSVDVAAERAFLRGRRGVHCDAAGGQYSADWRAGSHSARRGGREAVRSAGPFPLSRYGEQVQFLQTQLSYLFAELNARGLFETMTVVVHGDHGSRILAQRSGIARLDVFGPASVDRFDYEGKPDPQDLRDRFSVLFAAKRGGQKMGNTEVTPISLIRIIPEYISAAPRPDERSASAAYLFEGEGEPVAIPILDLWGP